MSFPCFKNHVIPQRENLTQVEHRFFHKILLQPSHPDLPPQTFHSRNIKLLGVLKTRKAVWHCPGLHRFLLPPNRVFSLFSGRTHTHPLKHISFLKTTVQIHTTIGFPGGSVVKNACRCRKCRFSPWIRKIPWRRKWQPTPTVLPGESHGQGNLVGYRLRGVTEQSDTTLGLNNDITMTKQYIRQITNKNLLYITGNSTQHSLMDYMGKYSRKKEWLCVYVQLIHLAIHLKLTYTVNQLQSNKLFN